MPGMRLAFLIAVLISLLFPLGCRKQPEQAVRTAPAPATVPAAATESGPGAMSPAAGGPLQVVILPASPTARDNLRASVSGAQGGLSYHWEVDGAEVDGGYPQLAHQAFRKEDQVTVTVASDEQTASTQVTIGNAPPEVTSVGYQPASVSRGQSLTARPLAEDIDGDPVSFSYLWIINGEEQSFDTGETLPGDRFHKGDRIAVEVVPNDGETDGPAYRTGEIVVGDSPPRFTSTPPQSFRAAVYNYQAHAEDDDGDPLTYRLAEGPQGMTIDAQSGLIQWPVGQGQAGEHLVKIEVHDADGLADTQQYRLNIALKD